MSAIGWKRFSKSILIAAAALAITTTILWQRHHRTPLPSVEPASDESLSHLAMPPKPDVRQLVPVADRSSAAAASPPSISRLSPDIQAALASYGKPPETQIDIILKSTDLQAVSLAFGALVDGNGQDKILDLVAQRPEVEFYGIASLAACNETWAWQEAARRLPKFSPIQKRSIGSKIAYKISRNHDVEKDIPPESRREVLAAIRDVFAHDNSWPIEFREFIATL